MPKRSAGLLLYRRSTSGLEVFLVHPGGPFWEKKELGAWSIPKGEYDASEEALTAARREFEEETGFIVDGEFTELGTVRQMSGKLVSAWAIEGDCDPKDLISNHCEIEWPIRSGHMLSIPEVDRGAWFTPDEARQRINPAQQPFLDALVQKVTKK
jgi:predicted NUDIX family NTP pyrophosphohydrolase